MCRICQLPKIADPRGNLTFIEGNCHVPFPIKRVFYLYDVPGGADRGGHALRECHQFLIAISGSFDVMVYDGEKRRRFHLNRSYYGLYIPPLVWREMENFSSGSVCLVLASDVYKESDYLRELTHYRRIVQRARARENARSSSRTRSQGRTARRHSEHGGRHGC